MRPTPSDAELVELFDRLWNDQRRRDDRSEFHECEHCGRAIRWIGNLASVHRSSLQIVARPVTTPAFFRPEEHRGLVAVYTDRTGFTVSRFTPIEDVDDTLLYECHWDVCEPARAVRDRMHRERFGRRAPGGDGVDDHDVDHETVRRYQQWRANQQ